LKHAAERLEVVGSMARSGTAGHTDAVRAAADELYGLPLDEFTAARNDLAKRTRRDGDAEAAAAIGKLAKPNTVAWLANQLARQHGDQIRELLELGDSMRQATALLDARELRELSARQHRLVQAIGRHAQDLAGRAGLAFSASTARSLEDTLHAAVADEVSARRLAQGRLTSGLSHTGFPGVLAGPAGAGAVRPAAAGPAADSEESDTGGAEAGHAASQSRKERASRLERAGRLERARRTEEQARSEAQEAGRAREAADAGLVRAEQAARQAADRADELRQALDEALAARNDTQREVRRARQDADRAGLAARQAERRLAIATAQREQLEQ
jgi:hypothetical protein